jgi:hypothetical protein
MTDTPMIIPPEIKRLLGKPPLIQGEDPERYWESMGLVAAALKPKDLIDWFWVKEIVDDNWESIRVRQLKGPIIDLESKRALELVLRKILDPAKPTYLQDVENYVSRWFTDASDREKVTQILAQHGLDTDCISAQAFALSERPLESMDRMVATGAAQRDAAWRQINLRHQAAAQLSEKTPDSQDAETETPPLVPADQPQQ